MTSKQQLSTFQIWMAAARPKTLAAAVVPVAVGGAFAYRNGAFSIFATTIALFVALLIQIGTNFTNDLYDFLKGADTKRRVGPLRVLSAGLVTESAMRKAIYIVFSLAFLFGMIIVIQTSWWLLLIGIVSIASGLAYTAGPYPLAYNGLGDIFVFIFFGFVATCGTYYVNTGEITFAALIASIPVGALITNILVVNNYRDVDQDRSAGKRTTAVIFGRNFARIQYILLFLLAFLIPVWLYMNNYANITIYYPLVLFPAASLLIKSFLTEQGEQLNKTLENTAKFTGVFGLLYALGIIL